MGKRASIMPSKAEQGGNFGFPAGSTVTITEAAWTTWEEAGEKAITKNRKAEDPCLKLVGEIEGDDTERPPVFLGAGKAERLEPSKDGEYLEIAEGSSAQAISGQSNANVFTTSLCDKSTHGKSALPEEKLDEDPISSLLVGLKFVAGGKVVDRKFDDDGSSDGKRVSNRPTLVADEIIEAPWLKGSSKNKSQSTGASKTVKKVKEEVEEEEEEDEKPKKKSGKSNSAETQAEKAVLEALENPKYRKGIPSNRLYTAVLALVKEEDNADEIMEFAKDDDWAQDDKRPWEYDSKAEVYKSAE